MAQRTEGSGSHDKRDIHEVASSQFESIFSQAPHTRNDEPESPSPYRQSQGTHDLAQSDLAGSQQQLVRPIYRLYRRRFAGVLGIVILNIVAGMNWPWFGPIANSTATTFDITLDQVNWLGNIVATTYLVVAPVVPLMCTRYGIRACFVIGSACLILAAWVRFAGTATSLGPSGAYALLIIGQFLSAISQCTFQVLPPKFSEKWFDLQGRTTATMFMSIANPVGSALGQLISPMLPNPRRSVLVLGIISTAATPFVLLISSSPPTPPSYSGSHASPTFMTTLRAIAGKLPKPQPTATDASERGEDKTSLNVNGNVGDEAHVTIDVDAYMHPRERIDFIILVMVFGTLVGAVNSFALLSNEILEPYGYSEDTAGLMGAALLLAGIVTAFATSPLFDRVLTHHLAAAARIACPIVGASWLVLIWAVRPNNTPALFVLFALIGACSVAILPVGLELGVELTRNAETSSAILWFSGNLWGIVFVLVQSALRASDDASPPRNMHQALIFNGAFVIAVSSFIFLLRGRQVRREKDVRMRTRVLRVGDNEGTYIGLADPKS